MSIAQTVPVTFPNAGWGALLITTTLALMAFCAGVDAGCSTATCPIDLGSVNHRLREHDSRGLSVQFIVESITQEQPRYGTDAVSFRQILRPDHDEIKTLNHNVNMIGTYAFDARWAFSLSLPLVQREHSHIAVAGHAHEDEGDEEHDQSEVGVPTSWDFTELSDPVLRVRFGRRSEDGGELVLGIGASLPLGATDIRSSDGVLAEPSLQPSTGGASLLLEASLRGHAQLPLMPKARRSMLDVSTELRLNAKGERDYRSGHQLLLHAGIHHALTERFDVLAQLATRWRGRDNAGSSGELADATGGVFVFASPGLQVELSEGLSLYGYYQWPLRGYLLRATRHYILWSCLRTPLGCGRASTIRRICRTSTGSFPTRGPVSVSWNACVGLTDSCARPAATPGPLGVRRVAPCARIAGAALR